VHTEALPSADRTCPNQNSIIPYYVKLYNTKNKKILISKKHFIFYRKLDIIKQIEVKGEKI